MIDVNLIKLKTIHMFKDFISELETGHINGEYCDILNNITFVQSYNHLDGNIEYIYEILMNRD